MAAHLAAAWHKTNPRTFKRTPEPRMSVDSSRERTFLERRLLLCDQQQQQPRTCDRSSQYPAVRVGAVRPEHSLSGEPLLRLLSVGCVTNWRDTFFHVLFGIIPKILTSQWNKS